MQFRHELVKNQENSSLGKPRSFIQFPLHLFSAERENVLFFLVQMRIDNIPVSNVLRFVIAIHLCVDCAQVYDSHMYRRV